MFVLGKMVCCGVVVDKSNDREQVRTSREVGVYGLDEEDH